VGIKLSWNVGALYTRKNDKAKLRLQRKLIENAREVFQFNNNMEQIQQTENIDRFKTMMQGDEEIITLRTNVRKAAESKLVHGIIDVNSLLREINNENAAKTQQAIHEIDMLKEMYALKYTNNE
jgi:outer membrane efflux protein